MRERNKSQERQKLRKIKGRDIRGGAEERLVLIFIKKTTSQKDPPTSKKKKKSPQFEEKTKQKNGHKGASASITGAFSNNSFKR